MKVIITGGAGFIGSNAASRYLKRGHHVVVVDDSSRPGVERNLAWSKDQGQLTFLKVDIRRAHETQQLFQEHRDAGLVLHLAGQVAVTTSVVDPRTDFEINALGTLNVLEGVRNAKIRSPFLYSSTNKVYGGIEDVGVEEIDGRYQYRDLPHGVSEERGLDFHSPYGCSKGSADQYVRDYHRIYGLATVVLRQSCIYGYRQFGAEDQGWVAWFMIALQLGRPITIYGDGKQVRDILFVDDLLDAYDAAVERIHTSAGQFTTSAAAPRTCSLCVTCSAFWRANAARRSSTAPPTGAPAISGSLSATFAARLGIWVGPRKPNASQGLERLYAWVAANKGLFE